MSIRVGKWDCEQCGFKGNMGPLTRCSKCGAPRPEDVDFYLTNESNIINDITQIKAAKSGADWVCSFCTAHNKATQIICQSCGNDRDITDGDESLKEKIHLYNKKEKRKPKKRKGLKRLLIGLLSFALLFVILAQFTSEIELEVTGFEWKRTYDIEEYKRVIEEDWQLPAGAEKLSSQRAVHHYDQVPDGTETKTRTVQKKVGTEKVKVGEKDLGNGFFEDIYEERPVYEDYEETYEATKYREVPVYKTKYKYAVFKWVDAGKIEAYETKKPAYWPQDNRLNNEDKFRVKKQHESYFLILKNVEETITHKVDFDKWQNTEYGSILIGEKSSVFGTFYGLKDD